MAIMLRILRKQTWERVSARFNDHTVIGPGGDHGFYSVKSTDELQMAEERFDGSAPVWESVPIVTIPAGEHPNVKKQREEREAMLKKFTQDVKDGKIK